MKKEQRKRLKELKKKGQDSLTSSEAHELCRLKFVARSDKDLVLVIISSFMCGKFNRDHYSKARLEEDGK